MEAGQTLLAIASDAGVWIVANYKETQLDADAARPAGRVHGRQLSRRRLPRPGRIALPGATGARFALLPPDNASGNYVKVTQRVPVKIVITDPPDPGICCAPG